MNYITIIALFAVLVVGFIVGYFTAFLLSPKEVGRLNIDRSDDTGDVYMFLEIDRGMQKFIFPGTKISLKVTDQNYMDKKWKITTQH